MIIGTCKVYLTADWVKSLKEKRSVLKSLIEKTQNKFNVSIAEIERMDSHKDLAVGFACVTNDARLADAIIQNVLFFLENNTDACVNDVVIEIL
ncbi:MAG: DUF503 domain-containing protein [Clostridiales bacterium]|jgi:uncharacterized protein YlxP (DUF503 family)|nr:DUF503 domain-containing protein [Clostridiales bacterium]